MVRGCRPETECVFMNSSGSRSSAVSSRALAMGGLVERGTRVSGVSRVSIAKTNAPVE